MRKLQFFLVIIMAVVLAGCTDALVGRWKSDSGEMLELNGNGTFVISNSFLQAGGTWARDGRDLNLIYEADSIKLLAGNDWLDWAVSAGKDAAVRELNSNYGVMAVADDEKTLTTFDRKTVFCKMTNN